MKYDGSDMVVVPQGTLLELVNSINVDGVLIIAKDDTIIVNGQSVPAKTSSEHSCFVERKHLVHALSEFPTDDTVWISFHIGHINLASYGHNADIMIIPDYKRMDYLDARILELVYEGETAVVTEENQQDTIGYIEHDLPPSCGRMAEVINGVLYPLSEYSSDVELMQQLLDEWLQQGGYIRISPRRSEHGLYYIASAKTAKMHNLVDQYNASLAFAVCAAIVAALESEQ